MDSDQLERIHVAEVYGQIAEHFSSTRYKAWPVVERYMHELPLGSVGADIGCGNGKNMILRSKDIFTIGLDL